MAWGCFCWIPCPYKKWNEDERPAMLAMLPLLGAFMGAIISLAWLGLILAGAGPQLVAAVVTAISFLLTGFIHLDGYMDCSDAVLPRHPDMSRRREILKDPHNGAFGIISLVLMLLLYWASVYELSQHVILELRAINWGVLLVFPLIMTISRCISVNDVVSKEPMETSQYADLSAQKWKVITPMGIAALLVIGMIGAVDVAASIRNDAVLSTAVGGGTLCVTMAAAYIAGALDRRALGGMNGDISGHMIVTGELFGLLAAALLV